MLLSFSVKNYMSFRDEVTLTMEKGNGDENLDNVFRIKETDILKSSIIYGANASGKSNLLTALKAAINTIRNSDKYLPEDEIYGIIPFMFDKDSKNKPTEFKFDFIKNNRRYIYYFSATKNKVVNETLEVFNSQKSTTIFRRTDTNKYKFINSDKRTLESIKDRTDKNKLFLTTATTWNYSKTKEPFMWFKEDIDVYSNFEEMFSEKIIEYKLDNSLKKFTLNLLKMSDIMISNMDIDYEYEQMNPNVRYEQGSYVFNKPFRLKNININFSHDFINDGKVNTYNLDFKYESFGTKKLFILSPLLKKAFETNKVIIFDEFEKNLHPNLVEYIVKLFNNKKINKANSQIIFTTHAVNLLDLSLVRRDQIWFTEKNPENGVTDLYPLDSFNVRKDENIQKGYIKGRYGAIPFIKGMELWEEK